ncbi:polynucleotidyl transferase, ribonuclease H-like superfamily protein isoform X2 [Wolffia australiana]
MRRAEVGASPDNPENMDQRRDIYLHAFSDLSHVSPAMFVYLMKECYICGSLKATPKFKVLQHQVPQALSNSPQPGPAMFVLQCLYILPILGPSYTEGFSHLLISSLRRLLSMDDKQAITPDAKSFAAHLFRDILSGRVSHEERILLKVLEVFQIDIEEIAEAMFGSEVNDASLEMAKSQMGKYISGFIVSRSYITAVALLERFPVYQYCLPSQSLFDKLIEEKQYNVAEKLAIQLGEPMIHLLVKKYVDINMLKRAYIIIKNNDLLQEFSDVYHLYKRSSLKKLARKGLWDIAEIKTNNERQLLEHLIYLAAEAGYLEKVDELCKRHSISCFTPETVLVSCPPTSSYLDAKNFLLDGITWVDDIQGLHGAMMQFRDLRVVGVDCEWKPNYEKGSKPSKVSIMQIASLNRVFIFDLIKLYEEGRQELDHCLRVLFHSSEILKLGYNFQCDIRQLWGSYGDLECFRTYETLLDIQKLFKEPHGGLSGLTKEILGAALNKTRRNSDWEQRPLSQNQVEYAALDAIVLVHIFHRVCSHPQSMEDGSILNKKDWRSHVISRK